MNRRRSLVAVAALSLSVLTACGASAPPAGELADELIDTMDFGLDPVRDADRIEEIRACMRQALDDFELSEEEAQGFQNLDDVAQKAADGQELAQQILDRFEAELTACN